MTYPECPRREASAVTLPAMSLSFAALDVETANSARGSVCSFGVTVVREGRVAETHHWLCQPPAALSGFDVINSSLHGLSAPDIQGNRGSQTNSSPSSPSSATYLSSLTTPRSTSQRGVPRFATHARRMSDSYASRQRSTRRDPHLHTAL